LTNWKLEAEYIQSCNCDYGCPCNFNALPTRGNCEALVAWNVRSGEFDGTNLDGVKFAWGLWWPQAIHMGNGTARLYVDAAAAPAQRKAIEEITGGKHGGGVFEIFPKTFSKVLPTKVTKIDFAYGNGYDSWFNVQGIGEVHSAHIKNPVTGADFAGEVLLPGGINFKRAFVTSAAKWSLNDGPLRMGHENRAGFATVTKYSNAGAISSDPSPRVPAPRGTQGKETKPGRR
jgi:hypothetical protein